MKINCAISRKTLFLNNTMYRKYCSLTHIVFNVYRTSHNASLLDKPCTLCGKDEVVAYVKFFILLFYACLFSCFSYTTELEKILLETSFHLQHL